ncbi:hypothetical protein M409DRAFT_27866 [Zasmidium cellare ATCC 36951]|uniref:Transcription initiation factor IIF subunit beta n=1 Tax=Zasmidium cellare ATCC 36951 TaxID=1080233 RepID=A0A6A6C6H8_ZASCE|nr:uncharacterized protein M409DRAFT_27866 [Zasmidium cellare ATCC 36951]KAF2161810.1 hypothetical protein M409DRAFT_27866 [Zasmidium cellare ATCC 36951]
MADVKAEIKPEIKLDPADSPTKLAEIDEFEDDTDLIFPTPEMQGQGAWLVKVSRDMWKAWNDIYQSQPDDAEVEVGRLRVYHAKPGDDPNSQKVELLLNDGLEQQKALPSVYNLEMKENSYQNTVVFSEKDLDRHRAKQIGHTRNLTAGKPSGIPGKSDRYGPRKPGSYRTAIPKQTILAPPIINEAVAKPAEDKTSLDFFKRQYDAAMSQGRKATILPYVDKGFHPGAASAGFTFGSITSRPGKGFKKKEPKEKNVRMPEDKLLDALQQCFRQYPYWSMSALRGHLRQPDVWIKEVLDKIAVLVRSGDFTGNYKLNDNTARLLNISDLELKEEAAPIKSEVESDQGTGDEMGDDDEDLGDFEDVKMEGGA